MQQLTKGNLTFVFDDTEWSVETYGDWAFYRNHFSSCCGGNNQAVDFLAYNLIEQTLWLIDVKDYRQSRRTTKSPPWEEIALKVRDTLAGIVATSVSAYSSEQEYASLVLKAERLRVVLHLEQPRTNSKLFPRSYNLANVQDKLKLIIKAIDPHPKVVERSAMGSIPWSVTSHESEQ